MRSKFDEDLWVTPDDLGRLEGISRCAVAWRCRNHIYTRVKKVRSHGGGKRGVAWLISLLDPAVTKLARQRYYLKCLVAHEVNHSLEPIISRLTTIEELLRSIQKDLRQ